MALEMKDLGGEHRPGPLNGWRAIANYLGRNQSTVKRWATQDGLPVHRPKGGSSRKGVPVYAFAEELDTWLRRQKQGTRPHEAPALSAVTINVSRRRSVTAAALLGAMVLVLGGSLIWLASGRTLSLASVAEHTIPTDIRSLHADGVYLLEKRTPASLPAAIELLTTTTQRAPDYAPGWAALATAYNLMVEYRLIAEDEGYTRSKAAAERAVDLDPTLASAQSVLADLEFSWSRDIDKSLARFVRAVALDPSDAQTRHWYASALGLTGNPSAALNEIGHAKHLDPGSRSIRVSEAIILLAAGETAMAADRLRELIAHEPEFRNPYRFLAFARLAQSDYSGYLDAIERRFELTEDAAGLVVAAAGKAGLGSGGFEGMIDAMKVALDDATVRDAVEPYFLAHFDALTGNTGTTESLRRVKTRHAFYYSIDPAFAEIRQDPDFQDALWQMKLPVL